MQEKYEELLNQVIEISNSSYILAEILHVYCLYFQEGKISAYLIVDFLNKIKNQQYEIIQLIDEKTTEIGYEYYLKSKLRTEK